MTQIDRTDADRTGRGRVGEVTATVDRIAGRAGPVAARWLLGLMWLSNVNWKVPPNFGGLLNYVQAGVDHPVLPGSAWVFEHVVLAHITPFGYVTMLVEVGVGALLVSGRFLRVAAVVSAVQAFAIGLAVANAPDEWYWAYLLMIGLSIAVLAMAPRDRATSARTIGVVVALAGIVTAINNAGSGFGGDDNMTRSLFTGSNDIPDEFGNSVFPGSVALGLALVVVGVAAWFLAGASLQVRRVAGVATIVVAVVLLLTYHADPSTLLIGLGSRAVHCGMLAAVGLALLPRTWQEKHPDEDRARTESVPSAG